MQIKIYVADAISDVTVNEQAVTSIDALRSLGAEVDVLDYGVVITAPATLTIDGATEIAQHDVILASEQRERQRTAIVRSVSGVIKLLEK